MSVRIAIDGRGLTDHFESGVRVYIRSMIQELIKVPSLEVDLFYTGKSRCPWIHDWFPKARFIPISSKAFIFKAWFRKERLERELFPAEADLIWLPDRRPFFKTKTPVVLTVHDLVPELYFKTLSWKSRLWHMAFPLKALLKLCDGVLFTSKSVASSAHVSLPNEITFAGSSLSEKAQKLNPFIPKNFFLFLAPADPRKGLDLFLEMAKAFPEQKFIWAGQKQKDRRFAKIKSKIPSNVQILGEISEAEKSWLFEKTLALLSLSHYEGFDLPVLEALQKNKAVLLSDIPVHREFYEGMFFNNPEECRNAIQKILKGEWQVPKAKHSMNWSSAAEKALLFFRSVILHKNGDRGGNRNGNHNAQNPK
jgi:glycosyltransferase involved in cell wall biosynthesis